MKVKVPVYKVPQLTKKIKSINKKLVKQGHPVLKVTTSDKYITTVNYANPDGSNEKTHKINVVDYNIEGLENLQIAGWEFVGTVSYPSPDAPVISSYVDVPKRFYEVEMVRVCEHCSTNRRRNDLYIIRNVETNEFKQVGKSCLKDFLKTEKLDNFKLRTYVIRILDSFDADADFDEYIPADARVATVKDVLCRTLVHVDGNGYVSSKDAFDTVLSTADIIKNSILENTKIDIDVTDIEYVKSLSTRVLDIIKYVESLEPSNQYFQNLKNVMKSEYIEVRHVGLVVSSIPVFERYLSQQLERNDPNVSDVIVGNGIEITGVVVSIKMVPNNYSYYGGMIEKMIVKDDRGFKVYGSVPSNLKVCHGDKITFTANTVQSKKDSTFGFFKRPRKSSKID
jgi:hypothetical protein